MAKLHLLPSFGRDTQPPPHFKGRRKLWQRREDAQVKGLCAHQTDVRGGFGPSDFDGLAARLPGKSEDRRGVPYHYFYSPKHATVFGVWHPAWYSFHGNEANGRTIGFAVDGSFPGDELDELELAHAVKLVVAHAGDLGYELTELTAHRQYDAGRSGDPGVEIWRVLERTCHPLGVLTLPDFTDGEDGQPIPTSWRPSSPAPLPETGEMPRLDLASMSASQAHPAVKRLQGLLLAHGYGPGGLVGRDGLPDGKAGRSTKQLTSDFRVARELGSGLVVDAEVWAELEKLPS